MFKKLIVLSCLTFVLTACTGQPPSENISEDVLDNEILDSSVNNRNQEGCNQISSDDKKNECLQIVESLEKRDRAIESDDASICETIELDSYKENCFYEVENQVSIQEMVDKRDEVSLQAIEKQDISLCEQISDPNFQQECILSVYTDPSYEGTDPSVCDNIKSEVLREVCYNSSQWSS